MHRLLVILALLLIAPVQSRAQALPVPLPVTEIADGVFVFAGAYELASPRNADAISNAGFIVGADAVAVIDTGGSLQVGQRLLAAIRARTAKPVRYVIDTHDHPDHVLGNAAFERDGTVFVGHAALPQALTARAATYLDATRALIGDEAFAGTRIVVPTLLVKDRLELDLGGRRLLLEAWPTAHTNTDITIRDEKTDTWFLGDLLFCEHVPALDGSLNGWIDVIDMLKARKAARVVPGHGPAVMSWPQASEPMERYLQRLRSDVRDLIHKGSTMQEAAEKAGQSERNQWLLFDDFNARNATSAYHELEWE
ncbi:hypothetical protein LMIY3S_02085 [Labrys miyagiensis]